MSLKRTATKADAGTRARCLNVTKRIRIALADIESIEPARDGSCDAVIITDRGATRVCEPYEECLAQWLGSIPADGKEVR